MGVKELKRKNKELKINWKYNKIQTGKYTLYFSSGMNKIPDEIPYYKNEIERIFRENYDPKYKEEELFSEVYSPIQKIVKAYMEQKKHEKKESSTIENSTETIIDNDLENELKKDMLLCKIIKGEF